MRTADDLLTSTLATVRARGAQHGHKRRNHEAIAAVWNGILQAAGKAAARPLDAHDVACLMEGPKIARRFTGGFNPDDYEDGAGYAAVAFEIKAMGQADGEVGA